MIMLTCLNIARLHQVAGG